MAEKDVFIAMNKQVIYEVNLIIDKDIYAQFQHWLNQHVREMLQIPGFLKASLLIPENESEWEKEKITIQYLLENREALTSYNNLFAPKMREQGIKHFKDKFSAERRVFGIKAEFLKSSDKYG